MRPSARHSSFISSFVDAATVRPFLSALREARRDRRLEAPEVQVEVAPPQHLLRAA